jgi:hypothetical protein
MSFADWAMSDGPAFLIGLIFAGVFLLYLIVETFRGRI